MKRKERKNTERKTEILAERQKRCKGKHDPIHHHRPAWGRHEVRRAHLLEDRLVVVNIVDTNDDLRRGGQGLWTSGGVVIRCRDVQHIFHSLQSRRRVGAEADQTCVDQ